MEKKRRITIITLSALFVVGLLYLLLHPTEPTYQGKTLTQWISSWQMAQDFLSNHDEVQRIQKECELAVKAIGTNGIPTLLHRMQARDSSLQSLINKRSPRLYYPIKYRLHWLNAGEQHRIGCTGFLILKKQAVSAVPDLGHLLEDSDRDTRYSAFLALLLIRPDKELILPILLKNIHNPDGYIALSIQGHLEERFPDLARQLGINVTNVSSNSPTNSPSTTPPIATK